MNDERCLHGSSMTDLDNFIWLGKFICANRFNNKVLITIVFRWWLERTPQFHTDPQFNTSVQHKDHIFSAPEIPHFNTKNLSVQTPFSSPHPWVQHTPQFNTHLNSTHTSVQHTPQFNTHLSSTHTSVRHTPQFTTPINSKPP